MKTPRAFDAMTKVVLAYRPKPKSKPAKRRKRRWDIRHEMVAGTKRIVVRSEKR
jgi:hypothetical protein